MGHAARVTLRNDEINIWVAQNIAQLMEEQGWKQASLAQKAGLSQRTVGNFLQPAYRVQSATGRAPSGTLTNLAKIATALEVPAWQLTRPTNKAERELYSRIEAAYRALVDGMQTQQTPEVAPSGPTDKQRALADSKRLPDLTDTSASNQGGKAS